MANKYKLGIIDCPWTYDNKQQNDPKRGGITYPVLTMEELWNIPIGNAFEKDSIIGVWITNPKLVDSFYASKECVGGKVNTNMYNPLNIIQHWGFRPVTVLFDWVKLNPKGYPEYMPNGDIILHGGIYSGMGSYTNSNNEVMVVARKGKGLPRVNKNVKQTIFAPIGKHSAKPKEQYERLDRLYGEMEAWERIEIFARKQNPPPQTWDAIGLDWIPSIDIREWIKQYDTTSF